MQANDLSSVGILIEDLNPFIKARLKNFCNDVKLDVVQYESKSHDVLHQFHQRLEGYNYDFDLPNDLRDTIEKEARKLIDIHEAKYSYFNKMFNYMVKTEDTIEFELERMWVNLQKPGDFLPIHNHSGVYSFVVWADIPFSLLEEERMCPNPTTIKYRAGYFQFIYTDSLGKMSTLDLPVDKSWEGKICLFPSDLHHQVYPYYSSNEYRISIAGNFRVKV